MSHLYPPSQNTRPNVIDNVPDNSLFFYNLPELNFATTKVGTLTFTTRGPSGTGMYVDWGDGSALEWIAHLGTGTSVATPHVYAGAGTKNIKFTGRLDLVTYLLCTDSSLSGDVGELSTLTSLTILGLYGTSVSGDVGELSTLTSLTNLFLYSTSVSGDVGELSTLTSLTALGLSNNSVSGDVGELSTLTSLTTLFIHNTSVSGDLGELSTLPSLVDLRLYNTSIDYNTTTLPGWSGCAVRIDSCGFTSTEVDNFLIDLAAAGGTNGTLNIAGTNAARTSASDAAKATLLTNGWVVTVNE